MAVCFHACSQRSLQAALRQTSRGLTVGRAQGMAQGMPAPLRRASTTSVLALSTLPLPLGQPAAVKVGYCMSATRLSK